MSVTVQPDGMRFVTGNPERSPVAMYDELIQVAAMAVRTASDVIVGGGR